MNSIEGLTQQVQELTNLSEEQRVVIDTLTQEKRVAEQRVAELSQLLVVSEAARAAIPAQTGMPAVTVDAPTIWTLSREAMAMVPNSMRMNPNENYWTLADATAHTAQAVAAAEAPLKRANLELNRVNAEQRLQIVRLDKALERAAAPQQHAQAALPKCVMCSGHGLIGGLMPGDGGYHSEDCPDCDGRGFVHGDVEYHGDGLLQPPDPPSQSKCEVCDGSGKVNPADAIAPAAAPAIQQEGAALEGQACLLDVVSHHSDFVAACHYRREACIKEGDTGNAAYWAHQIATLNRMADQARAALAAPAQPAPVADAVVQGDPKCHKCIGNSDNHADFCNLKPDYAKHWSQQMQAGFSKRWMHPMNYHETQVALHSARHEGYLAGWRDCAAIAVSALPPADAAPVEAKPVAWAAESNVGSGMRMLTKISLLESEVDRYVNRKDMDRIGCNRVKVPLFASQPSPAQGDALSQQADEARPKE